MSLSLPWGMEFASVLDRFLATCKSKVPGLLAAMFHGPRLVCTGADVMCVVLKYMKNSRKTKERKKIYFQFWLLGVNLANYGVLK
jgi:hypothetical protein